jgi:uncharacterized membrane protein
MAGGSASQLPPRVTKPVPIVAADGGRSPSDERSLIERTPAWVRAGAPLLLLTALAAFVRFATLGSQSYWFDEAQAAHEFSLSLGSMLHLWNSYEPNPPLYFVVGWVWARVFGTGEVGLRSLSALLGTGLIPLVYLCGRDLISRRAGLFAAALAAVNPFLIWYSQEAREYMLLAVLSAASFWFFARSWRTSARRDLVWWTVCSALALLTAYFAGFIVAAEALLLIYRVRSRVLIGCFAVLAAVEGALVPHLIKHASHPADWIATAGSLSVRVKQVPVGFAVNTLYKGPALSYGLLGAAVLALIVIGILLVGATGRELRGAALAAIVGAVAVLVPLGLALVGHDYYEVRALIGGWVPLAVLVGAACAATRARLAGALLFAALIALFIYGGVTVQYGSSVYRRPDWKGVADALGPARATRAVVAYDGQFATPSLALYMPGVAWTGPGQDPQVSEAPATVRELDVVGDVPQQVASNLPAGIRLISARRVDDYLVDRFALPRPMRATPAQFGALALRLLGPAPPGPAVLIQRPSA